MEEEIQNETKKSKKTNVIITIKVILFILIGLIILQIITPIFVPTWTTKYDGEGRRMKGFYQEPKNSIDVLMIGNSDLYRGISTMKLWEEYGIASYNMGSAMQTPWTGYYTLKEAYQYQSPKLVIIETDSVFEKKDRSEPTLRKIYDNMRWGEAKVEAIMDPVYQNGIGKKLSYVFPIMRFHSRWSELKLEDITKGYQTYESQFKGYSMTGKVVANKNGYKYMDKKRKEKGIPQKSKEYLEKTIELCRKNNTQVLLLELPSTTSWSNQRSQWMQEFAKQQNVPFIDLNYPTKEYMLDWSKDTEDKGNHLNIYGAEKTANYLGKYIKENYQIPDRRNDSNYTRWNESLSLYEKVKKEEIEKNEKEKQNKQNQKIKNNKIQNK